MLENMCNSLSQSFHLAAEASSISSSHPEPLLHKSCSNSFALKVTGATNPSGSYSELINDKRPRRVRGFAWALGVNRNMSLLMLHCTPKVLSIGDWSRFFMAATRAFSGMHAMTSLLLLSHFVSLNPPLWSRVFSSACSLMASSTVSTDLTQSSI